MNSDTKETTEVSEIEVSALNETMLVAQEKKSSLSKRGIDSKKNVLVPFENLVEDGAAKQVFAHVKSIFAGNSICDRFWKWGNDTGSKTQWFPLTKQRQMCYVHPVQQCEDWLWPWSFTEA